MRLTRHADYALRVLMYLALRPETVCTVHEIAAAYGISESHLMKVAHRLGTCGVVETTRGRGGGIRLGLAPEEITAGRVVRLLEEDLTLVECFAPKTNRCRIVGACSLTAVLERALEAFLGVLDETTIADLAATRRPLLRRLSVVDDEPQPPRAVARARAPGARKGRRR